MTRTVRSFATIVLFLVVPAGAAGQDATDILTGRIIDASGRPVDGAWVEVTSLITEITRRTTTDEDGKYVLLFPDGGGQYAMEVTFLGLAPLVTTLMREGDEEVLIAELQLGIDPLELDGLVVQSRRPAPGRGDAGAQTLTLPQRLLDRLPLPDFDPLMIAALAPGVILTEGDTLNGLGNVSITGQRDALNQVTLDGGSVTSVLTGGRAGGSPLGVPEEGVRSTQVVTSTYDVSRGQFSGGLIAMTSARGSNRLGGSASYNLKGAGLQTSGTGFRGSASTQHRVSGGVGGALVTNKIFYNVSALAQSRRDDLFALQSPAAENVFRLGASPDSVARFLDILNTSYGVSTDNQVGEFARAADGLSLMGRVDFEWTERHSVMLRLNGSIFDQDNAFIGPTELMQNGGLMVSNTLGAQFGISSRIGGSWINQLRASLSRSSNEQTAFEPLPEGRVFLGSAIPDYVLTTGSSRGSRGTVRGVSTLVFGGDRTLPTRSDESTLELANELSFLLGFTHRLKLGVLASYTRFEEERGADTGGTFFFNSLADLEAMQANAFTRALSAPGSNGSALNAALYLPLCQRT